MDEHLGKPIDLDALVRTLTPAPAAASALAPESARMLAAPDTAIAALHGADEPVERLLARFGWRAAFYLRSLDAFLPEAEALLARARAALAGGDRAAAAAAIHSLKGAAGTVGARGLAAQMAGLERALKEEAGGAGLLSMLEAVTPDALRTVCARLRRAAEPFLEEDAAAPAPLRADELGELHGLLASGNLRALDLAERLAAHAAPDSPRARLAEQIRSLDFAAASATLARLAEAAS